MKARSNVLRYLRQQKSKVAQLCTTAEPCAAVATNHLLQHGEMVRSVVDSGDKDHTTTIADFIGSNLIQQSDSIAAGSVVRYRRSPRRYARLKQQFPAC